MAVSYSFPGGAQAAVNWSSTVTKRPTRSSMAAEPHALAEGCEGALHSRSLLGSLLGLDLKVVVAVDCLSLFKHLAHGARMPKDRSILRSLNMVRGFLASRDIGNVVLVRGPDNAADGLTRVTSPRVTSDVLQKMLGKRALPRISPFQWLRKKGHSQVRRSAIVPFFGLRLRTSSGFPDFTEKPKG